MPTVRMRWSRRNGKREKIWQCQVRKKGYNGPRSKQFTVYQGGYDAAWSWGLEREREHDTGAVPALVHKQLHSYTLEAVIHDYIREQSIRATSALLSGNRDYKRSWTNEEISL